MLEKNEGEKRTWRPDPGDPSAFLGGFVLKVTPKSNGSQHLVLGTEDMAPGDEIPRHKHLGQDEVLLIEKGTAHIHLGDQQRELHAGGMAFIPAYTWVSVKNLGPENVSLVFLFSAPGFEAHMRCESVPANEKPTPMSTAEEKECNHVGHVLYSDGGEEDRKN